MKCLFKHFERRLQCQHFITVSGKVVFLHFPIKEIVTLSYNKHFYFISSISSFIYLFCLNKFKRGNREISEGAPVCSCYKGEQKLTSLTNVKNPIRLTTWLTMD